MTIDKVLSDNGFRIKFLESDVVEEIIHTGKVKLSLPRTDLDELDKNNGVLNPVGMEIVFENKIIGTVIETFNNSEYDILVVKTEDGREFLIPDVETFIEEKNPEKNEIIATNIKELMNL